MNILLSDARHIPHHRRKSAGKGKESIQLLSTPGHRPRSVLLFFCSSLSKSSCGQKKSAATVPSRTSFPKASAKVRTFSRPAKFFTDFFQKKMHFCTNGTQNGEARGGADTYLLLRTRVRERTDGASSRKRRKGRKGRKCCPGLSGLSSKNYGRFIIKDNGDNLGQLFLSRIGELENLYSFYL